jgi:hypothetical protein
MGRAEDLFQRLKDGGESEIDTLIQDRQSEELFLDFKRSADNGRGSRLQESDRENLAKAISGFGNSEGGVIVWGVDCRQQPKGGDVPQEKHRLEDSKKFVSWLEGAVSGCTLPPHPGVEQHTIASDKGDGFVVTYVPKSFLAPHQCLQGSKYYYVRAGSSFSPAPHGVLAGLFGRAPQPTLCHRLLREDPVTRDSGYDRNPHCFKWSVPLVIENRGLGLARDLYFNAQISKSSPFAKAEIRKVGCKDWAYTYARGETFCVVSPDSFKLAPGGEIDLVAIDYLLQPPFEKSIAVKFSYGSTGSPRMSLEWETSQRQLDLLYRRCCEECAQVKDRNLRINLPGPLFASALLPAASSESASSAAT